MKISGKIGAVIFSPGSQRDCAVGIVLEGQNAEDAYNVTAESLVEADGKGVLGLRRLMVWLAGVDKQPSVTMTVDEFRTVLEAVFTTETK